MKCPVPAILVLLTCSVTSLSAQIPKTDDPAEMFKDAMRLFERGKTEASLYLMQQVQKKDPTNIDVLLQLGEMAISSRNWAYAIEVLEKAARLKPTDVEIRLVLMDVYKAYQMPIQEIMAGEEIMILDPRHAGTLDRLAALYEDQAMPDDEEQKRRRLAQVRPDDYENLRKLAVLQEQGGKVWEATWTYERIRKSFPGKTQDALTLARLHGQEGDRYAQIRLLQDLSRGPASSMPRISEELDRVSRIYKIELNRYDPVDIRFDVRQSRGAFDRLIGSFLDMGYRHLPMFEDKEVGFTLGLSAQLYEPTAFINGETTINSWRARYDWRRRKGPEKLILKGGFQGVEVTGRLTPALGAVDVSAFPWLDPIDFGGTTFIFDVDWKRQLSSRWDMGLRIRRHPMEELDAFVRSLTTVDPGFEIAWHRGDQTRAAVNLDHEFLSDGNRRRKGQFRFDLPLISAYQIRSLDGSRVGYLQGTPDWSMLGTYLFDYIDLDEPSRLYEFYRDETRHTLMLGAQLRTGRGYHTEGEIRWTSGKVLQDRLVYRLGLTYRNEDTLDMVRVSVLHTSETIGSADQQNITLVGKSSEDQILVEGVLHFDTTVTRDPAVKMAHR